MSIRRSDHVLGLLDEPSRTLVFAEAQGATVHASAKRVYPAGQVNAVRRLLDRDPVGHGQLYQAARCRLCLVERRG